MNLNLILALLRPKEVFQHPNELRFDVETSPLWLYQGVLASGREDSSYGIDRFCDSRFLNTAGAPQSGPDPRTVLPYKSFITHQGLVPPLENHEFLLMSGSRIISVAV